MSKNRQGIWCCTTLLVPHKMDSMFKPPSDLSKYISDDAWSEYVHKTTPFHDVPLNNRLDFIEQFAKKCDWTNVGFGSLMDPTELDAFGQMLEGAVLRRVNRARALLDAGNTDAATAIYLELMRASSLSRNSASNVTEFGGNDVTLLGDIIVREWAREYPAMEHAKLTATAEKLLGEGMEPVLVAKIMMPNACVYA